MPHVHSELSYSTKQARQSFSCFCMPSKPSPDYGVLRYSTAHEASSWQTRQFHILIFCWPKPKTKRHDTKKKDTDNGESHVVADIDTEDRNIYTSTHVPIHTYIPCSWSHALSLKPLSLLAFHFTIRRASCICFPPYQCSGFRIPWRPVKILKGRAGVHVTNTTVNNIINTDTKGGQERFVQES